MGMRVVDAAAIAQSAPEAKQRVRDFLRRLNREQGTTILLTSHYMDDVAALCPRVIVIDKGKLLPEVKGVGWRRHYRRDDLRGELTRRCEDQAARAATPRLAGDRARSVPGRCGSSRRQRRRCAGNAP